MGKNSMDINKNQFILSPPPLRRRAFTLAEILVTLVIIGVVAAFTISALINSYVESSTVAKVKKGLSTIGQAKKLAELQHGPIIGWEFSNSSQIWDYLKPYVSLAKDCGTSSECYPRENLYYLNGSIQSASNANSTSHKIMLADGSLMWLSKYDGKCVFSQPYASNITDICASVGYDINGSKAPNTIGKDIFYYYINIDGVYPIDHNDCRKTSSGWGCAAYIIKNNNMKYLH